MLTSALASVFAQARDALRQNPVLRCLPMSQATASPPHHHKGLLKLELGAAGFGLKVNTIAWSRQSLL